MAEATDIEWADSTFNPWMGCTKVSPACDHCYAETLMDRRYGKVKWGPHGERVRTAPSNWQNPRRWQRQAAAFFGEHGRRRRVFCASLADVFDNHVPAKWRKDLWQLITECPDIDWLLLTKRPQNIARMLPAFWDEIRGRVWLGTSTENQDEADRRLPHLLAVTPRPAVFFASAEPLLGPIDFRRVEGAFRQATSMLGAMRNTGWHHIGLSWIITGGESGPGARPTHPDWIRSIRLQCQASGVPFLFKQWGEWAPGESCDGRQTRTESAATFYDEDWSNPGWHFQSISVGASEQMHRDEEPDVWRVGKKRAGRLLDGVTHDAFPEARP
jgi:protein gp37